MSTAKSGYWPFHPIQRFFPVLRLDVLSVEGGLELALFRSRRHGHHDTETVY
jgi:hypothetical protein